MKKGLLLFLMMFLFIAPQDVFAADQTIQIKIDGETVPSDAPPIISESNRVLVPIRVISESLGYRVWWGSETQEVHIYNDDIRIKLKMNEASLWKNDEKFDLDVVPLIHQGRTFLPIRAVSENLGTIVNWNAENKSVEISTITTVNSNDQENVIVSSGELLSFEQEGTSITFHTTNPQLEHSIFELKEPNRLVVDLNHILLSQELQPIEIEENEWIEGIRFSQYELNPDKVRIVLDLKRRVIFSSELEDSVLKISLTPYIHKVFIDAGHGGKDPGAIGVSGSYEKDLNLSVAMLTVSLLENEPYIQPILSRETDQYLSLDERVTIANDAKADLFLSIHANAFPNNPEIRGIETFYSREESSTFARLLHKSVLSQSGFADRMVHTADFRVIKNTVMPAALIEMGYLTNAEEEKVMLTKEFQQRMAEGIKNAVVEYLQ